MPRTSARAFLLPGRNPAGVHKRMANQPKNEGKIVMPKLMVTHTLPPKGISRDQFCQIATTTQQDPHVKCHESFANLTEGKVFCYWDAPQPEALAAWFK